jgi:MFS family permease
MERSPSPFRYRDFRFYWGARLSSNIANMGMVVVIGWQVYDIARRTMAPREAALQLGFVGLAQFLPLLALTLVAGWTADRIDRRWIARAALTLECACAAFLAWMAWYGTTSLPALFAVAALLGVARAFMVPALGGLAPNLVPTASLPSAIAMSSLAWQAGGISGPALGGYLYAGAPHLPYLASAALFAVAVLAMSFIGPVARPTMSGTSPWRQMIDGLHYVRRNRLVLGAISLDLFAVLLGGATAMLPVYARDILHVGSEGLGHLRAAPAIGASIVALWFAFRPLRHHIGAKMLGAVAVFGAATALFGLTSNYWVAIMSLAVVGAADMFSVYVRQSLIQLYTPDEMRGRVGAVSSLFISASNELGEAQSGFLAALVGPVTAVVAGGIGAIAVTALWNKLFPELRRARRFEAPAASKEQIADLEREHAT